MSDKEYSRIIEKIKVMPAETEKERAGGRRQQADASECREKRRSDGNRDADTG